MRIDVICEDKDLLDEGPPWDVEEQWLVAAKDVAAPSFCGIMTATVQAIAAH